MNGTRPEPRGFPGLIIGDTIGLIYICIDIYIYMYIYIYIILYII